ncbi:MAG: Gfo/Idh/MocA family oxidoreductase [Bacteroidota bacterium]
MQTTNNRRRFLKNAGLGTAALLTTNLASANKALISKEKKLGVALLGLGYYAEHKIRPGLLETQYCELKGIVTGTPAKEKVWMEKYGVEQKNIYNYENFDSIAENPDIDMVYVVLPNSMHAEYVIRAAKAGKHVICEKPFDVSYKAAAEAVEVCKKEGRLLQIGYRCQYDPSHRELMRIGREQEMGKIKVIQAELSFFGVKGDNWRFTDKSLAGGGALMDVGVYCIQGARYSTGEEPIAVRATTHNTYPNLMNGMEETILFTMKFPSGAVANLTASYAARGNYLHISAEKGNYGLKPSFGYSGADGYIGNKQMNLPKINQQAAQMDAFARNILDKTPVIASGEEGLRDMRIIESLYKSARKGGKWIKLA